MRISRYVAENIASILVSKKRKSVEKMRKDFEAYVTSEYNKQVPKSVKMLAKKHPAFFDKSYSVLLHGHGFNHEYVNVVGNVINNDAGRRAQIKLDAKIADEAYKLKQKWDKENAACRALKTEIANSLCNLRTFAQIEKHLPEAVPHLPKSTSREIAINFDGLRAKIKAAV